MRSILFASLIFLCAADPIVHTTRSLRTAVALWCTDPVSAEITYGHISEWDTSEVTDMSRLFKSPSSWGGHCATADTFNDDLSCWDTGNVRNMKQMFLENSAFNQPIVGWDVSKVTSMAGMFYNAVSFNQPLAWNTGQVVDMEGMFEKATSFNQEIVSGWDIANDMTMDSFLASALSFNQNLCWQTAGRDTQSLFDHSGGGMTNPFEAKCACVYPGTYYDGHACTACPDGQYSLGKVNTCFSCPDGFEATRDRTSCFKIGS